MMDRGASELGAAGEDEAAAAPGRPPEPRVPEPRAPVPEPGLDLSLSPLPASPEPRSASPGRRKGRQVSGGGWPGPGLAAPARRPSPPPLRSQVRFRLAPASPARPAPPAVPQELQAPAPQSSLALGLQLRAARSAAGAPFDAVKAAEEQLRTSFQARCGLEGSVAEGLNVPRSRRLFRNLVSLQVPEEQVLKAALREKLALLPPPPRAPPPKEPRGPGPDMTILCDPETLFHESPHLTLEGLPPLRLQPRTRPSEDTFLMHRTLRRWEA
ncbi:protein phosphatase 1 regulatory subunit 35 [Ctenodactylus gundi]